MADENEREGDEAADESKTDVETESDEENEADEENLSTVGSGRVDALFDELEATIESLDGFANDLTSVRNRIEANEGETSPHVRNRVTQDADQLSEELDENADRVREALRALERTV